ncbi:MAG: ATP synthase subunit alpha [Candidatus Omnitrophica bacterium]|nr:ATP synthase subunit alpha [Candidatus Omnitrophota bacterium]
MAITYKEYGSVISKKQCIVTVDGLENCIFGQLVDFEFGSRGFIVGFNEQVAQVLLVKERGRIKAGEKVVGVLKEFRVGAGNQFLGRIVTPLGEPRDGLGPIRPDEYLPVFRDAPSVMDRDPLDAPLETGIKIIDSMIPIGKGQRELLTGDRMSGKTTVITDTILNQKGKNVICIYVDVGKAESALKKLSELFQRHDAFKYTIIVSAGASATQGEQYLAPYVACSLGEYFMYRGGHVFVAFDDFSKHAWAYREISLLLNRPPGRNAYPGDIFYLHSKMIERAGFLNKEKGNGTMTFIPIVETLENDITSFVCSNLVSMTDGQIVLNTELFSQGFKPSIDLGLSVSRVGTKVQWPIMKKLTASYRLDYLQYRELVMLTKLNKSDLTKELELKLKKGEIFAELILQPQDKPVPQEEQVLLYYANNNNMLLNITIDQVREFKRDLGDYVRQEDPALLQQIRQDKKMTPEIEAGVQKALKGYLSRFIPRSELQTPAPAGQSQAA